MATITPAVSGAVTVDIAAEAARDAGGNPSAAAVQVLDRRGPDAGAGR